jgi:uncharacterized protein (PEP-CTERM system associated)
MGERCGRSARKLSGEWSSLPCLLMWAGLTSLVCASGPALAGDWTVTRHMAVRETYTDNLNLAHSNEKSDLVTEADPGISVRGRGRRLQANLDYNMQAILIRRQNAPDVNHQLQANATAELVKDRAFLDAKALIYQSNITNTGRQATSNISVTGNTTTTYTYSISPHVQQRLGDVAVARGRYTFDQVINSGSSANSFSNRFDAELASGSDFTRLLWSAAYNRQYVNNQNTPQGNTRFETMEGTLRYLLTRHFSVFANGGRENNHFQSVENAIDGPFWRVGATWRPSRHTSVEGSYGKRFFGHVESFDIRHQMRRFVLESSYDESVTTVREYQLQQVLVPLTDAFGNPIVDPLSGVEIEIPIDQPTLTDEVVVSKLFQGSTTFQGRRTGVTLRGYHERRQYQSTGENEKVIGALARANRQLSPHTTLGALVNRQKIYYRTGDRVDTRWQGTTYLQHQFGVSLYGRLQYRYTKNNSNISTDEYHENRVTALVSWLF